MSQQDEVIFNLSKEVDYSTTPFIRKDYVSVLDMQNGSYSGNQSVINTSQLMNSSSYASYYEAFLSIPVVITVSSTTAAFNPVSSGLDGTVSYKNGFHNLIHNLSVQFNGSTVVQLTNFCNMYNSFKLMTTMSFDDYAIWSSIGFYPDSALSFSVRTAASTNGIGVCNNVGYSSSEISPLSGLTSFNAGLVNLGSRKRNLYIAYDPDGVPGASTYSTLMSATNCRNLYKSHVSTKVNQASGVTGVIQYSVRAIVYLRHLHSFFEKLPLVRGAMLELTLQLNNCNVVVTTNGTKELSASSISNPSSGICPLMIASTAAGDGSVNLPATATVEYNLSVGNRVLNSTTTISQTGVLGNSIMLYVPLYTMNPFFEEMYLSERTKTIKYEELYQYKISSIAAGSQINQLITNGLPNLRRLLILPFRASASLGATSVEQYMSPFDTASVTTAPLCMLNQLNVQVAGRNVFQSQIQYSYETFLEQLYGCNSVNGGLIPGLSSSLIGQQDFEMLYCYHYFDLSRTIPADDVISKSVQITATNQSAQDIVLFCFIAYEKEVKIDIMTGAIVM